MSALLASVVVFLTSAVVLVLEILAGRLLAPYLGVTLQTYTGIIGVVLAGIAIGSWAGGRLADRVDPRRVLGPAITLGGVLALGSPLIVRIFGPVLASRSPVAIVTLATLAFFAPALVLSSVTPLVIKLRLSDLDETGQVVGRLSALGTIGALVGTFVTGFVLVAAFPSEPIVIAVGGTLLGLGVWLTVRLRVGGETPVRTGALVLVGAALAVLDPLVSSPCQVETAYFCARVVPDEARAGGRLLVLDTLRHSYVDLDDPTYLDFSYARGMAGVLDTFRPPGEAIRALHIGGGGFTLPAYLEATRPGTDSLVLELDPSLVQLATDQLGLETSARLRVETGDARLGVDAEPADTYDLVIGDAFGGLAVPWHLATRELVESVERVLVDDGVYALNLIDHPPLGFARAETATLQAVFEHVAVITPAANLEGGAGGNFVLVGSNAPIDVEAVRQRLAAEGVDQEVAVGQRLVDFVDGATVLTDAYAPVDQLLTPAPVG